MLSRPRADSAQLLNELEDTCFLGLLMALVPLHGNFSTTLLLQGCQLIPGVLAEHVPLFVNTLPQTILFVIFLWLLCQLWVNPELTFFLKNLCFDLCCSSSLAHLVCLSHVACTLLLQFGDFSFFSLRELTGCTGHAQPLSQHPLLLLLGVIRRRVRLRPWLGAPQILDQEGLLKLLFVLF